MVIATSSAVSTGIGDHLWPVYPTISPGHSGPLSLAIRPWVGSMSTGDGVGYGWGRNGEFCIELLAH